MTAFLHAHPYILPVVLLVCVAVLAVPTWRSGRALAGWLRGWLQWRRYSRDVGPRHQAPARKDPFWGDVTWHDTAWDEIRDELGDDYATEAAPCDDPECSQTTHTGQMAALDAEALSLMADLAADGQTRRAENLRLMHAPGTPSFYPYAATQTVNLPPWEREDEDTGVLTGEIVPAPPRDAQPAACDTDTLLYLAARKTEFARELAALAAWGRELTGASS